MVWSESYETLRQYLRSFNNFGDTPAYDTVGILMLLLALVDNLRESPEALARFPELGEAIEPEQAEFLGQLARWAAESRS